MAQSTGLRETINRATTPIADLIAGFRKKPKDKFKVTIVTGSVTLCEENRPGTWKKISQYFQGHAEQRRAGYMPHRKHRDNYARILETGRENILAVVDYCREYGFEIPSEADFMLMRYEEWLDWLAKIDEEPVDPLLLDEDSEPTDPFPILEDPAIQEAGYDFDEERSRAAFQRAVDAAKRAEERGAGLFEGTANGPPIDGQGIHGPPNLGARPKDTQQAPPARVTSQAPPVRGATVGATVAGMTLEQLKWVVQAMVNEKTPDQDPPTTTRSGGWDNKRYKDLEPLKFEGDRKEYPAFRQSLQLCLDRMDFPTGKDKAIYVYKFLKGTVREKCSYFMSTLTDHSYQHMLAFLDDGYGTDESYDLVAIERLAALPKLRELTQDNVLDHLAVIGAATGPLLKLSPEALRTPNGEKYFKLLRTLPVRDQDQYFTECRMFKAARTLDSLTGFLRSKLQDRKHGGALGPTEAEGRPAKKSFGRGPRPPRARRPNPRKQGEKVYLNAAEEDDSESEDHSADDDGADDGQTYAVTETKCAACSEGHGLDKCPKFKKMDMNQRREIVRAARACNGCLRIGHFIRECRSKRECGVSECKRRHHPLMHDEIFLRYFAMEEGCEPDLE